MDGPEKGQDPSQVGDPSDPSKGTSTETKTYTKESEEKAVSDALSVAGRDAKTLSGKTAEAEQILTDAKKMSDDLKAEREQWQKDRDDAEREAHKDDPDALTSLNEKIRQRNEAAKLAGERVELDADKGKHQESVKGDLEQIKVFNRTQLAAEVAVAKGVDIDSILKLTTEDSREAMEATANLLTKGTTPLKTDSSTTIGGGRSFKQLEQDYADGKVTTAEYEAALKEQHKL